MQWSVVQLTTEGDCLKIEGVEEMLLRKMLGDLEDLLEMLPVSPFFPPFMLLFNVPLLLLLLMLVPFFTFKVSMLGLFFSRALFFTSQANFVLRV